MNILTCGKCSDIIAACAVLSDVYNRTGQRSSIYCAESDFFPQSRFQFVKPLVEMQPYIQKFVLNKDSQPVSVKRNRDQDLRDSIAGDNGVSPSPSYQPWISVPQEQRKIQQPYIVLAATPRYRCCTDFRYLKEYAQGFKIVFIGQKYQYDNLCRQYAQYYPVKDITDAAQLIRHSSLFIGTQTLFTWLAQAMGVDRIIAVSPVNRTLRLKTGKGFRGAFLYPVELTLMLQSWRRYRGKEAQVGYVISTDGNPAYVQLQLEAHKRFGHQNILISDNGSRNQKLKQICQEYGAVLRGWDTTPVDLWTARFRNFTRGFGKSLKACDWIVFMDQTFLWKEDFQAQIWEYDKLCWKPCLYAPFGDLSYQSCLAVNKTAIPEDLLNGFYNGASVKYRQYAIQDIISWFSRLYGKNPYIRWNQILESQGGILRYDHNQGAYLSLSQAKGFQWTEEDFKLHSLKLFV